MTNLPWLIYLADTISSLSVLFVCLTIISILILFVKIHNNGYYYEDRIVVESPRHIWFFLPVVLVTLAVITPSKTSMYAFIISSIGDGVYLTDVEKELVEELKIAVKEEISKAEDIR